MANDKLATINVLLIENDIGDAFLIEELLTEIQQFYNSRTSFQVKHVRSMAEGLKIIDARDFQVAVMDLSLPDSQNLDSLEKLRTQAPDVPLVVFTSLDDEDLAVKAVEKGAQDYILKNELVGNILARSLRYAIERHRLHRELHHRAIMDDLTGLYNRRGFFTLGDQEFKRAKRMNNAFLIIFADLDGLKRVNDTFGHEQGDQLIIEAAKFLKETFRDSDIIARIGGDEFAILAYETAQDSSTALKQRLEEELNHYNRQKNLKNKLSLSLGITSFSPETTATLDQLLSTADSLMYLHKKEKQR
ncbi:MAG: diguanylate cyclase [Spirochaeta sp.]|nr:diguanylate cyclase [Spirochaeta sp.]